MTRAAVRRRARRRLRPRRPRSVRKAVSATRAVDFSFCSAGREDGRQAAKAAKESLNDFSNDPPTLAGLAAWRPLLPLAALGGDRAGGWHGVTRRPHGEASRARGVTRWPH